MPRKRRIFHHFGVRGGRGARGPPREKRPPRLPDPPRKDVVDGRSGCGSAAPAPLRLADRDAALPAGDASEAIAMSAVAVRASICKENDKTAKNPHAEATRDNSNRKGKKKGQIVLTMHCKGHRDIAPGKGLYAIGSKKERENVRTTMKQNSV